MFAQNSGTTRRTPNWAHGLRPRSLHHGPTCICSRAGWECRQARPIRTDRHHRCHSWSEDLKRIASTPWPAGVSVNRPGVAQFTLKREFSIWRFEILRRLERPLNAISRASQFSQQGRYHFPEPKELQLYFCYLANVYAICSRS